MARITIPNARVLQHDLRDTGFCSYKGENLGLADEFDQDKRILESVFEKCCADGPGRRRFYSRYIVGPRCTSELLDLDVNSGAFLSSDYRQSAELNPEQRGILRSYAPLPEAIWNNRLLKELILFDLNLLPMAEFWSNASRNPVAVGIHLIRMHAAPMQPAMPSPSIPHQDGEPFTCIHLIGRQGARGGVSQVYKNSPVDKVNKAGEMISEFTLTDMLDTLIVWDKEVFHHVTPVEVAPGHTDGFRDVLIIDFAPFEECKFDSRGEVGISADCFNTRIRRPQGVTVSESDHVNA